MDESRHLTADAVSAFAVFADTLSLTRAAAILGISQPALHVKIGKLGDALGVPLYRRVGRRLVLTGHGERVARYGRDQRERAQALVHELSGERSPGPVVLAAGRGAYLYLLGPGIRRFVRRAEHAVRLVTAEAATAVSLVESGRAHLGVAALDAPPDELETTVLARVEQVLVLPSRHRLAARREIRLRDLAGEALVVPPPGRPHREMIGRMLADAGAECRVAVEAQGWELMIHFVALGIGIAVVNGFCRIPPGLVTRPLPELPAVHFQLFRRRGLAGEGVLRLLQDLIAASAGARGRGRSQGRPRDAGESRR